jgi:hypothetical protein
LRSRVTLPFLSILLTAAAGCGPKPRDNTPARAADEWTRMVPFERDGEINIVNRYGSIEVTGGDPAAVAVKIERIAQAPNEAAARTLVPKIAIEEIIGVKRLSLRTEGIAGVLIGVSFETNYRVSVPPTALVRLQTAGGAISIVGIKGRVAVLSNTGTVTGKDLGGAVDVRTMGGEIKIDLSSITDQPISIRAGRGAPLQLSIPPAANANLSATATNANISVERLPFYPLGEPERERARGPRRVRGRINKGGTPIELSSVGGDISVRAREAP